MANTISTLPLPPSTLTVLKRRFRTLISRKVNRDLLYDSESDEEGVPCDNIDYAEAIARPVTIVKVNPRTVTTFKPGGDECTARLVRLGKPKSAPKLISLSSPTAKPELPKIILTAPTPPETCTNDHDVFCDPQFAYRPASNHRLIIRDGAHVIMRDPTDTWGGHYAPYKVKPKHGIRPSFRRQNATQDPELLIVPRSGPMLLKRSPAQRVAVKPWMKHGAVEPDAVVAVVDYSAVDVEDAVEMADVVGGV